MSFLPQDCIFLDGHHALPIFTSLCPLHMVSIEVMLNWDLLWKTCKEFPRVTKMVVEWAHFSDSINQRTELIQPGKHSKQ